MNTKQNNVDARVLFIILASLSYCFIPNFETSAGLASIFYHSRLVNRIYFASLLYILPALLAYLILQQSKRFHHPIYLLLSVIFLMGSTAVYSKWFNHGGTYYQNINSIRNSLNPENVGINLSATEIDSIKTQLDMAKINYGNDSIVYCANFDKSHIIRYLYRQKNILFDRFVPHEVSDCVANPKAVGKRIVYIV